MKIRDMKKRLNRRFWFNKTQILDDGSIWPARRHGLRYGDVRGHCKVKLSHVGQKELLTVPHDDMADYRKKWKKRQKKDDTFFNRQVRNLDKLTIPGATAPFTWPKHMSFKDKVRYVHQQSARDNA